MSADEQFYPYTIKAAGPDWITASASTPESEERFEAVARQWLWYERSRGGDVSAACRLGFVGQRCEGFFWGRRPDASLIVISGPRCTPLAKEVITAATNVSRLDLQVTIDTGGEQPHLALQAFETMKRMTAVNGRHGSLSFITSWPNGETLYANKRISDYFGRYYDKSSEMKLTSPRVLWRAEVEVKRKPAFTVARQLVACEEMETYAEQFVRQWWLAKGVEIQAAPVRVCVIDKPAYTGPNQRVLTWFEQKVCKTVSRGVELHGAERVVESLGLSDYVDMKPLKEI